MSKRNALLAQLLSCGLVLLGLSAGLGAKAQNLVQNGTFSTYRVSDLDPGSNPGQAPTRFATGSCASNTVTLPAGSDLGYFSSGTEYIGAGLYAPDTKVTVQCGNVNYMGGLVGQTAFPGDPRYGVPSSQTWLYSDGNTTGGPYTIWEQTLTGLNPNTRYVFALYTSNAIDPAQSLPLNPRVEMQVSDQAGMAFTTYGSFEVYEDGDALSGHGGVDLWDRRAVAFTTAAGQTGAVLRVRDVTTGSSGDDLAMTALSVRAVASIAGKVYEDVNYGGGAGRPLATAGAVGVANATVELYNNTGLYIGNTVTGTNGDYAFSGNPGEVYTVRVVNSSVVSSRLGYVPGLLGVQTFNGAADRVGGEAPEKADAPAGGSGTTLPSLTTATTVAQSQAVVTLGAGGVSGVDFGFNFDLIVNTNDTGQGSLRQFIANANALGNEGTLAQAGRFAIQIDLAVGGTPPTVALPTGRETSIFMVPDGLAHPGLRAGLANQLSPQGVAVVAVQSYLGDILGADVAINGLTQTYNVGNTNDVLLGTGGTVGVDALPLSRLNGPEVRIQGSGSVGGGLRFYNSDRPGISGISLYGFGGGTNNGGSAGIYMANCAAPSLTQNVLAPSASSFGADPGAGNRGDSDHIGVLSSPDLLMTNNLVAFAEGHGLNVFGSSNGAIVTNNEFVGNGQYTPFPLLDNISVSTPGITVQGNRMALGGGKGLDNFNGPGGNCLVENNTIEGNGQIGAEIPGLGLRQTTGWTVRRNIIRNNIGSGVLVVGGNQTSPASGILISQNSIYGNGQVPGRETGSIGIDLQTDADTDGLSGNAPYVTLNDDADADTGGNGVRNFPVLTTATVVGGILEISGFAASGALIEVFGAQANTVAAGNTLGNDFGQGKTYLFTQTEGSGQDLDATTGSYGPGPINGVAQGSETNQSRFRFRIPLASLSPAQQAALAVAGVQVTATATLGGETSEFSGNAALGVPLTGIVFEDANYGGGAGRSLAASGGSPRPGATVELYNNTGGFLAATTTDAAGQYSFSAPAGAYTVRVVSGTVSSARPGYVAALLPVQTFNEATDRVGGEAPEKMDAPANAGTQTLASLTTATATAQSVAAVTAGAGGAGADFGFNFDLIVNTNDAGQGSLRQFIRNSNNLSNEGGLAQAGRYAIQTDLAVGATPATAALPAGRETSIFMIADGQAHPGLRAAGSGGPASQLTAGVAVITPLSGMSTIVGAGTAINGLTQTYNVGNTNDVLLGTGGTVGVDALPLSQLNGPEVRLQGTTAIAGGLTFTVGGNAEALGISVYGFGGGTNNGGGGSGIRFSGCANARLSQCVLAPSASSFGTDPGPGNRGDNDHVGVFSSTGFTMTNNLVGFGEGQGLYVRFGSSGLTVTNNEFVGNGQFTGFPLLSDIAADGINATIVGNRLAGAGGPGIYASGPGGSCLITNNTVENNGRLNVFVAGIALNGTSDWTVSRNVARNNVGAGVIVTNSAAAIRVSQNSIYGNGQVAGLERGEVGIDLQTSAETDGLGGNAPFVTLNDDGDADAGGNDVLNYPVLTTATVSGGNLTLTGFAAPGALLEVFVATPNTLPSGNTAGNNFGQGSTLLFTRTEGSGPDLDNTTGSYGQSGALVNGFFQGTETNQNRFRFSVPLASLTPAQQAALAAAGVKLTATATVGGVTSEFGGNVAVGAPLSGVVFEDVNYGGGAGRSQFASSGVPVGTAGDPATAAAVELYSNAGAFVAATQTSTTAGSLGRYEFSVPAGAYTVRVVGGTVRSTRPGAVAGLLPVQTFNSTPDRVGGEAPEKADAPANAGSQTLSSLATATATAQSLASVTLNASGVAGVDFGFNFDLVVNTNDAGQGSLRQFILNSSALSGENTLAQAGSYALAGAATPLPAGQETSIFMISDGGAHPGLRAGLANQLSPQGVALLAATSQLPDLSGDNTTLSGETQTFNIGNTNPVVLGAGGTVGTNNLVLDRVQGPEVQLRPTAYNTIGRGLVLNGNDCAVNGLAIYGFGTGANNGSSCDIATNGTGVRISRNVVGTPATAFADPGAGSRSNGLHIYGQFGNVTLTVTNNLIGYGEDGAVTVWNGRNTTLIQNNEIRGNSQANGYLSSTGARSGGFNLVGNLFVDNVGGAFDNYAGLGGITIRDNTITGNNRGSATLSALAGANRAILLIGPGNVVTHNVITNNYGPGVQATSDVVALISENFMAGNGGVAGISGGGPVGTVGIDLQNGGDDYSNGTAPYVTLNDDGDGDTGANGLLNYPVLTTATVSGGNLVLSGFATAGALLEVFVAAPNALPSGNTAGNNFGQGSTLLFTRTEGSGPDLDNTTGSYGQSGALVNGFFQGTETGQNRFRFSVPLASLTPAQQAALAAAGVKLTATATVGGLTSEFSGNVAVGAPLSGVVFEDVNYGGGAGRSQAASAGVPRPGAAVELYDNAGALVNTTTTDAGGAYSFSAPAGSYTVRVVSASVTSSRPGYVAGLLAVPTFNGTVDRVGGEAPAKADAPANAGSQTLTALTTATTTAQALAPVLLTAAGAARDFGFNFSTVVNANFDGQGSLLQFIINASDLGGETALAQSGARQSTSGAAQPLPAGKETSIFMVPNAGTTAAGTVRPGLRPFDGTAQGGPASGLNASGVVAIVSPTGFATVGTPDTYVDGTTQTANIGNTNNVVLGTGGTVGAQDSVLVQLNGPEVQLRGSRTGAGLYFSEQAIGSGLRGVSIYGFGENIFVYSNGANLRLLVEGNVVGTSATSFTDPGPGVRTALSNVVFVTAAGGTVRQNLIGFAGSWGLWFREASNGNVVRNNEVRGNGQEEATRGDAMEMNDFAGGITVVGNLLAGNAGEGIDSFNYGNPTHGGNNTVRNNTISNNGFGNAEGQGIRWWGNNNTTTLNRITGNRLNGAVVVAGATGNVFSQNSFSANGGLGFDLSPAGNDLGDGPTLNDAGDADTGSNNFLNFPVLETATVSGGNLVVRGFSAPGALVELFAAAIDPTGFGEGQTYLFGATEGSALDGDATTGAYGPGAINGLAQGQDNTNRFAFSVPLASLSAAQQAALAAAGVKLTATATLGGNTSEFGGNVAVGAPLSGVVFEDVNYGGGAGRSRAASAGVPRPGATVELYTSLGGTLAQTVVTDASGRYEFSVPNGSYTVRVVVNTVSSSRPGYVAGLLPVLTYEGSTNYVGGQVPNRADAPANTGSQPLAVLTTGTYTPQAIAVGTVSGGVGTAPDFGFNFSTVVNTNATGLGSLQQFVLNSNALGGEASLAQAGSYTDLVSGAAVPLPAGQETSVFMISDSRVHPGLRAFTPNQLTAQGVALIKPSATLLLTGANAAVDGRTQTFNIGNTNNVTLGTGGTVGVNSTPLVRLNGPEVQLQGSTATYDGLQSGANAGATSNNVVFAGLAVYGFQNGIVLYGQGNTVTQMVVGTPATAFADPGAGNRTAGTNIAVLGNPNRLARIANNLIGFAGGAGISQDPSTSDLLVTGNEIARNSTESDALDGLDVSGGNVTVTDNLVRDNGGMGYDGYGTEGKAPHTITGNTFRGNGNTTNSPLGETTALRVLASGSAVRDNIIADNVGAGVLVGEQTQNVVISRNSIFGNGTVTGQVGIDLQAPGQDQNQGTVPYVTLNDDGDGDAGGNNLLNYPVLQAAQVQGGNLVLTGFASAGAQLEFYFAQPNALATGNTTGNNFGQGKTFLLALAEGGGADLDATTGSYGQAGALVNGFFQGTETNQQRFRFRVPLSSLSPAQQTALAAAGTLLTATATLGGTSEFAGNVPVVPTAEISGFVFEDANYGGGAGRSLAAGAGVPRPGATVELYTGAGAFVGATTTDAAGQYVFNSGSGTYTVRVVSGTVTSSRPGFVAGLLPVQTFVNGATDRVGGEAPDKADAPANAGGQTLGSLTTATATAQSAAAVTVGTGGVSGVDFGFNFDLIVNANDAGQGSLRQFLANTNALGGESALAQAGNNTDGALPAGRETSVFMVSDGQVHPGQRAGLANSLTSGVAAIAVTSALPALTGPATSVDGTTQTANIGNTNAVVLGTGGSVGTAGTPLAQVAGPEVQVSGNASIPTGFDVATGASGSAITGLAVYGFGNAPATDGTALIQVNATGVRVARNVIGSGARTFADPAAGTVADGIRVLGGAGLQIAGNLIGFNSKGITIRPAATGPTITGNEVRRNGNSNQIRDGIDLQASAATLTGNLVANNFGNGIDMSSSGGGHLISGNTVADNGRSGASEASGIRLFGAGNTISQNVISGNYGAGVLVTATAGTSAITQNAIFDNGAGPSELGASASGQLGIDLLSASDDQQAGTAPFVSLNDAGDGDAGANGLLNFPVLEAAQVNGGNLVLTGFAAPGALLEVFLAQPNTLTAGSTTGNNFGQGKTYLFTQTEGSGADTDATTGSYGPGAVNGFVQGTETGQNRFRFSVPLASLSAAQQATLGTCGTRLTVTATLGGATSEFSGNVALTPPPVTIRVTGANPVCAGGTVRLSTGPRTGFLFTWYNGTTIVNGAGSVLNDSIFVANTAGSYTVQLTPVGCAGASITSPAVVITVLPAVVAGTIAADQSLCAGAAPAPLTGLAATGGTGTFVYQWESSLDNSIWTAIGGATAATYAPGPITATTYFRRQATSGTCAAVPSNAVAITLLPGLIAGTIAADQTVCAGATPAPLTGTAATGGNGTYAYQWESSPDNSTWTAIAGATGQDYAPGAISATTSFRRQATSGTGTCATVYTSAVTITVPPALMPGTISADQTLCAGFTPAPLTGTAANGGTGTYAYQWQSSPDNAVWTNVAGATSATYAPGPLSATTYYRRQVTSGTGTCAVMISNVVTLTVTPGLLAGTIAADQTVCAGATPAPLTGTSATGGTGTYAYQWESSLDNVTFAPIGGATAATYAPGPLTQTTYYRRQVTSGTGTCATALSNVVTITVNPALVAGSIAANQSVSSGSAPAPLTGSSATGGTGTYAYQWESSTDNVNFTAVAGATGSGYAPGPLTQTTYYRRQVTSGTGTCAVATSNTVIITVLTPGVLVAGTIGADQTLCAGATPTLLTGPAATGGTGTYAYQWESSPDNNTWTAIAGATATSYAPGPVTATTYFRRRVTSGTGAGSTVTSNVVTITVTPGLLAGTVAADQNITSGATPAPLTGTAASGGTGTYAYQWEVSTDNGATWTAITGATALGYAPGPLTAATSYRRQVTSGTGTCAAAVSNVVTITVTVTPGLTPGTIAANQTVCAGATPAPLTGTAATGGNGTYAYQWQSSANNMTFADIAGATGQGYAPGLVSATTYYRRLVTSGAGAGSTATSNVVTIVVAPALVAGSIAASQTVCAGATPAPLTGTAASGGTGTYAYQWEISTDNGATWTAITGATALGYAPGPLTAATSYRRQVTSGTGTCAVAYTGTVSLTVSPALAAGSIGANQNLCAGATPARLTSLAGASGGTGTYAYQWESSLNNNTWNDVVGATAAEYAPSPLAVTTYFRRRVTSGTGTCAVAYTPEVALIVTPALAAGLVGSDQSVCANTAPAPLTGPPATGGTGTYTYQWQSSLDNMNWVSLPGATSLSYAPGSATATTYFRRQATSGTGTCATEVSNTITLTVTPAQAAGISLASPPPQCAGSVLTFRPVVTNGGQTPTFRWFVNNGLTTVTTATFTSSTLADNDQVRVELTPTPGACFTGMPTATVVVRVLAPVAAAVTIRALGTSGPACAGTVLSFGIDNATGTGLTPQYQWLVNGIPVPGSTGPTFSSGTLRDNDRVSLQLTSSASCASPAMATSNELVVTLRPDTLPTLSITGPGAACTGTASVFSIASSTALGTAPAYQWRVDGSDVPGATGATFSSTTLRDGQLVTLAVRTLTTTCNQPVTVVSNAVRATIIPAVDVDAGPDKEIAEGESVVLEGTANGSYPVEWTPSLGLSFPNGPLRPVASPTVTTVYTLRANLNGCQDESRVTVKVGPPIRIPNAFSPNNDGINDTWEIDRIGNFPGNTVRVYNRWGSQIFSTTNYGRTNEWNGTSQGRAVPVGTYYYVINLGGGKSFSGSLTVVY